MGSAQWGERQLMDIILWVVAVALFLGTTVRWIVLSFAVSWAAWLGFVIGASTGAHLSGGSMPALVVSGLALAAAAHMANGYRLAVKYGLTGRKVSEKDAAVVASFRDAGLDRGSHSAGSVQQREASKQLLRPTGTEQAGRQTASQASSSARRPIITRASLPDRETTLTRQTPTRAKSSSGTLYDVEAEQPSDAFVDCWHAAVQHLNSMVQDGIQSWLKATPTAPFREHLSFRLGNQLFLIRIEDATRRVVGPNTRKGLLAAAHDFGGWPCVMPMSRARDGRWEPVRSGWGLVDARDDQPLDPFMLVTDEEIEMTDWELHQFAVQVVEQQLVSTGVKVSASQGNLGVDPSIWFEGDTGPEWVVVRAAKYPKQRADVPPHWGDIVASCRRKAVRGHFASVAVAGATWHSERSDASLYRLLRGHGMYVRYAGLSQPTGAEIVGKAGQ